VEQSGEESLECWIVAKLLGNLEVKPRPTRTLLSELSIPLMCGQLWLEERLGALYKTFPRRITGLQYLDDLLYRTQGSGFQVSMQSQTIIPCRCGFRTALLHWRY